MRGQDLITDGAIAIKDGRIVFVGKNNLAAAMKAELCLEAKRKVAMPGLVNCHTHVPMTLFRGAAEDQPLDKWLKNTVWPLEAKLRSADVYDGALLGCLEMIKSGTTCFADMYFNEHMVAEAVRNSGLRAVLAEGIIESGDRESADKMLEKSVGFAERFRGYADDRVTTMLGPHAAYSCSPEILEEVSEKASKLDVGVHIHLAEDKATLKLHGEKRRVDEVEFLDRTGFLKGNVLAAHCIHLSGKDMRILADRGVNIAYVPVANMKLGLGSARAWDLLGLGVNVALGTDGAASNNSLDMFETMKFASLLQKLVHQDPTVMPALGVLKMATLSGARALGLDRDVSSLEAGKKADVILVDASTPHLTPMHNVCANLVYSARGSDVDTVIVDGKILMRNRRVLTLNERVVVERAEKTGLNLLSG
jgi:5-methylthioadenosine/S-adenosylhomocysteine deaminase